MSISFLCDIKILLMFSASHGWIPEWPKGTDCKSAAFCFGGSNPPPPIPVYQDMLYNSICQLRQVVHLPVFPHGQAGVAELADAQDLKSCGTNLPYRFDSGRRHKKALYFSTVFFLCPKTGIRKDCLKTFIFS